MARILRHLNPLRTALERSAFARGIERFSVAPRPLSLSFLILLIKGSRVIVSHASESSSTALDDDERDFVACDHHKRDARFRDTWVASTCRCWAEQLVRKMPDKNRNKSDRCADRDPPVRDYHAMEPSIRGHTRVRAEIAS